MDAIQESLNQMMENFNQRMDTIEGQLPKNAPGSPGSVAAELASFKVFALASMRALQCQISMLAQQVDHIEMQGRRKILLLHGLPEVEKEDTSAVVVRAVVDHMKLSGFSVADINRCHRMGRAAGKDRPRPVLFKLRDVGLRDKIWSTKTNLKGSGITLSEFLTKTRHNVFLAARQRFGVSKCWTRQGHVFVLGSDGTRHRVSNLGDLGGIGIEQKESTKPSTATTARGAMAQSVAPLKMSRRAAAVKK